MKNNQPNCLKGLLIDTCWFAMTDRCSDKDFITLAKLRARQGFTAIQVVVGIPPECGPENRNTYLQGHPAWTLKEEINQDYLRKAFSRIKLLNEYGLKVIVYGAWGYQIEWMSDAFMKRWWSALVNKMDKLDVIYCLTGEIDLWPLNASRLLPDLTTTDLINTTPNDSIFRKIRNKASYRVLRPRLVKARFSKWDAVLKYLASMTRKPILVHASSNYLAYDTIQSNQLLCCNSMQSGHSEESRQSLWRTPVDYAKRNPGNCLINLEPWYEGIRDDFGTEHQLFAFWVSLLSGNTAVCYGAHGVWNIGDGVFLSHWGNQDFITALKLETPKLLGKSHQFFTNTINNHHGSNTIVISETEGLISISRDFGDIRLTYCQDVSNIDQETATKIWLPLTGKVTFEIPDKGPVVMLTIEPG